MKFRITHTTQYRYSALVSLCHNVAHLRPRRTPLQTCRSSELSISPTPSRRHEWQDAFGNRQDYFSIQEPHSELTVTAVSEVDVTSGGGLLDDAYPVPWEEAVEHLRADGGSEALAARQYVLESSFVEFFPEVQDYTQGSFGKGRPLLEAVEDLMRRIHRDFTYDPTFSSIATPVSRSFMQVCTI